MSKSENLYSAARELIPGGVNSPVRAFTGVGGTPLFIEKADGAYLYDVDGKAYIDYVGSWGPMVLGHNHPAIRNAVIEAAERGLSFGAPTEMEVKMAQLKLWCTNRNGSENGATGDRTGPDHGYGAHGELRHRGDDERHPSGPWFYRSRQNY